MEAQTIQAYKLMHRGTQAFAEIENHGMRVDVDYCKKQMAHLTRRIDYVKNKLQHTEEVVKWKKIYGDKFNMDSNPQLADVLFNHFGYETEVLTAKGNPSASQESLESIGLPITEDLILMRRLLKARDTYISNFLEEQVNGYLHSFFNLHTVVTFRSSCSRINFQNQPTRIDYMKRIIRRAIIPRPGFMIGEIDYGGIEVKGATFYHKDPNMIDEIINPERDMHRDMAVECYKLEKDAWTKEIRYCGKNKFVFPQFYGDYYVNCAKHLWTAIDQLKLKTKDGTPLKKHLKTQGLGTLKRFERHIQKVEDLFWNKRFPVYNKWKERHWQEYQRKGYVDLLTGFRCKGVMSRNDAINYPIQGVAFHCLLWSLIRLHDWLKDNDMQTRIIGQIHDSIVLEIYPPELNEVLAMADKIMTVDIRSHWIWINVPLEIEVELSPVDGSWYLKKEVNNKWCDKCYSHWQYVNKTQTATLYQCPVCGNKGEEQHGMD